MLFVYQSVKHRHHIAIAQNKIDLDQGVASGDLRAAKFDMLSAEQIGVIGADKL